MKHLLLLALVACTHHSAATWKDPAGKFTVELGAYKLDAIAPHNGHNEYHFSRPGSIDSVDIAYIDAVADYDRAVAQAKPGEHYVRGHKYLFECNSPLDAVALAVCNSLVATD
jgi:hypothetical protein